MKFSSILLCIVLVYSQGAIANEHDRKEVKRVSLGYLVALQQLKPELMAEVMHPNLAKRTSYIDTKTGKVMLHETSYEEMIQYAKSWNIKGDKFPKKPTNKALILDLQGNMASVKLESDNWVEYLHLVKIHDQWKIVNLYWQYHPKTPKN